MAKQAQARRCGMTPKIQTSAGQHYTAAQICEMHGISRRMFFNALKVRRTGCDELSNQIRDGHVSIDLALLVAQFNHDSQRLILDEFPSMKPRDRAGFVKRLKLAHDQEQANG
jgi:hypothetical protein